MTIVASNSITVSNINDGSITHTAYSNSADGTDGFTVAYPNLNLLDGTKDFSGTWTSSSSWITDGTYKGLTVKKKTTQWSGIYKTFTAPKDGVYAFSAYVKASGSAISVYRFVNINNGVTGSIVTDKRIGDTFDWLRDSFQVTLKAGDIIYAKYEITSSGTDSILLVAGHKWEEGSVATPYMPSGSEVTTADWPSYIGQYTDFTQADSTNPSDYTWSLIRGNDGKDGADGIAGKDGKGIKVTAITYQASANGTTAPTGTWSASVPTVAKGSFLWTRTIWTYTDNTTETGYAVAYMGTNGNNGTDGIAGKDGVGIRTTTITYAGSTSGTTAPSTGWTSAVPTVAAGSYLWTKTVWAYTDNTSETGYSVAMMGLKGDKGDPGDQGDPGTDGTSGIIVSSVAPVSPQTGQLWQDTSTTPQLVKKWTGNEWVIWELYAQNLKADTLETISATIGKISNTFDNSSDGIDNKGTITIEDSIKVDYYNGNSRTTMDLVASSSGQGLFTQHLPDKTDASKFKQAWYMPTGLYFTDSINNWTGQITAENVTLVPWTNLTYSAGYTTAEDSPCQYRKIKNLDGSYTVQFRGQVKPTSGSFPTTNFQFIAPLPTDIRPIKNSFAMAVGDIVGAQTIRIGALMDGRIQIGARGTATAYIAIDALTYII